jgi:hypothetical protein
MNNRRFMIQASSLLKQASKWVDIDWDNTLSMQEEELLFSCTTRFSHIREALTKLHRWVEENPHSSELAGVVYLIGGIQKLTNSWASQNISK